MKQFIFFTGFLILFSCKEENKAIAQDVMDKDKFIEVLKDKSLAEAALNVNVKNVDGAKFDSVYNFNVYKENGVTRAQYDSTLKYYSAKPNEFKEVMEEVLEKLNLEKAKH